MLKINLLPKSSDRRTSHTVVTCRSGKLVPLKHPYVSTNITVYFPIRQQSALEKVGLIIEAAANSNFYYCPIIIVCRGSRRSTEIVCAVCWCGVKIWIRTGVTKTAVLFINNLNGIKGHAVSVCKFCSVVVIYGTDYNINSSDCSKLPLSLLSQCRYQLGFQVCF